MDRSDKQPKQHTYRDAGVDIDANDRLKEVVRDHARSTFTSGVVSDVGFFGGLYEMKGFSEPILISSTDGVGTKIKLACAIGKHEGIGADLVNHCVNDILCCGASPLFFQDYIAMAKIDPDVIAGVVKGMADACRDIGCALIGGETAEMPGVYPAGEYDLVGFIVGAVERSNILDGKSIMAGDALIGLPSSGLHTNGYSLVRRVFETDSDPSRLRQGYLDLGRTLGEALLEPHRCYFNDINPALPKIKGLAHITGGGIPGNQPRTLPVNAAARIDKSSWEIPAIFKLIQQEGNVAEDEMYKVFNMGIGMIVVCGPADTDALLGELSGGMVIGEITEAGSPDERVTFI
ncbi:MAG: phosphoribosylformylglycinamidine cyclo-ligase [Chloroflexota bacterium]|nr:phosphoribosylformylglycinamidine cyclo-ligase [Chloroflexota bacterium]